MKSISNSGFLCPYELFWEKNFLFKLALFANFKCICAKNKTISNFLLKVKTYFLLVSINLRLIPIIFWTLKVPTVLVQCAMHPFGTKSQVFTVSTTANETNPGLQKSICFYEIEPLKQSIVQYKENTFEFCRNLLPKLWDYIWIK